MSESRVSLSGKSATTVRTLGGNERNVFTLSGDAYESLPEDIRLEIEYANQNPTASLQLQIQKGTPRLSYRIENLSDNTVPTVTISKNVSIPRSIVQAAQIADEDVQVKTIGKSLHLTPQSVSVLSIEKTEMTELKETHLTHTHTEYETKTIQNITLYLSRSEVETLGWERHSAVNFSLVEVDGQCGLRISPSSCESDTTRAERNLIEGQTESQKIHLPVHLAHSLGLSESQSKSLQYTPSGEQTALTIV